MVFNELMYQLQRRDDASAWSVTYIRPKQDVATTSRTIWEVIR